MKIIAVKLAIGLIVGCQSIQLIAQTPPRGFDFARTKIGDWSLRAETQILWRVDQGNMLPRVEDVNCFGQSADADLSVTADTQLDFFIRFRGPSQDGDLGEITATGDHLWLYIDGERWEYANIELRPSKLLNLKYPVSNRDDEIITLVWRGHQAVRKSTKDPWTNFDLIQGKLLSARKIAWGFKSRDWTVVDRDLNELPKGWQTARYPINNAHWQDVVDWCTGQVASDSARILPIDLLKHIEK